MKTQTTTFLIFLTLISAISCKKDDNPPSAPTNADLIVGTWDMTGNTVTDGNANINVQGIPINTDFTWTGSDLNYKLTFGKDGKVNEDGSFRLDVVASVFGQPFNRDLSVATSDTADVLMAGNYKVADNLLMAQNNGKDITVNIVEVTENSLLLRFDLAEASPEQFDVIGTATGTNDVTFTRN